MKCLSILPILSCFLWACGPVGQVENRPPSVTITYYEADIMVGGTSWFNTTASDPDGDDLAFSWYVDGFPAAGETNSDFEFVGPSVGSFTIGVQVTDGFHTDFQEAVVSVGTNLYFSDFTVYDASIPGIEPGATITCVDVAGSLFAIGTAADGFSYSTDGGSNWTSRMQTDGLCNDVVVDIAIEGDCIYIACFQGVSIYDTSPAGFVASPASADIDANAITATSDSIFAATDDGLRVADRSDPSTWETYNDLTPGFGPENRVTALYYDTAGVFIGSLESCIVTDIDCSTFSNMPMTWFHADPLAAVTAIWGNNQDIAAADAFSIAFSSDGGQSWADAGITIGGEITSVCRYSNRLFACKYGGPLMISDDFGKSWYSVDFPPAISGAFGPNGKDIVVAGQIVYLAYTDGLFAGTLAEH